MHFEEILRFNRSIGDPIHGMIRLSAEEIGVIDHPLFRRLHKVQQNGLLHFIFPAATHTRFEHSIGVLHMASTIFWNLLQNSYTSYHKEAIGDELKAGRACRFDTVDSYFARRPIQSSTVFGDLT